MMVSPISAPLIEYVTSSERWSFMSLVVNFDGEIRSFDDDWKSVNLSGSVECCILSYVCFMTLIVEAFPSTKQREKNELLPPSIIRFWIYISLQESILDRSNCYVLPLNCHSKVTYKEKYLLGQFAKTRILYDKI